MKRLFVLFLLLVMTVLLSACVEPSKTEDTGNTPNNETAGKVTEGTPETVEVYHMGDTVVSPNWELTVTDFHFAASLNMSEYDIDNFLTEKGTGDDFCYAGEDQAFAVFVYDVTYLGNFEEEVKFRQNISLKYKETEIYRQALPTSSANITEYFYVKQPPVFEGDDDWYFEAAQYTRFNEERPTKSIRAYFVVPQAVVNDSRDASVLSIRLDGQEYIYAIPQN